MLISVLSVGGQSLISQQATAHCSLLDNTTGALCGSVPVPENHANPTGSTIEIAYIILKATTVNPSEPPLIYFSGGPGGKSLTAGTVQGWSNHPIRNSRDIILFDQRGIGYSTPLPNFGAEAFDIFAQDLTFAEEEHAYTDLLDEKNRFIHDQGRQLQFYNSFQNASDVGLLMDHLGGEQYNLYGVSYGTRLARIVQDLFPNKVHASILNSPSPLNSDFLADRITNYNNALKKIFAYCEQNESCSSNYPDLRSMYLKTIEGLKKDPMAVSYRNQIVYVNPQDALVIIRRLLYSQNAQTLVPGLIRALYERNISSVSAAIEMEHQTMARINLSMLLAVERYESFLPGITRDRIEEVYEKNVLCEAGLGFFHALYFNGQNWHSETIPEQDRSFHPSDVPTLIMVNYYDPVTPPSNATLIMQQLKNGHLFVLDQAGHGGGQGACRIEVMLQFMKDPSNQPYQDCLKLIDD